MENYITTKQFCVSSQVLLYRLGYETFMAEMIRRGFPLVGTKTVHITTHKDRWGDIYGKCIDYTAWADVVNN